MSNVLHAQLINGMTFSGTVDLEKLGTLLDGFTYKETLEIEIPNHEPIRLTNLGGEANINYVLSDGWGDEIEGTYIESRNKEEWEVEREQIMAELASYKNKYFDLLLEKEEQMEKGTIIAFPTREMK